MQKYRTLQRKGSLLAGARCQSPHPVAYCCLPFSGSALCGQIEQQAPIGGEIAKISKEQCSKKKKKKNPASVLRGL